MPSLAVTAQLVIDYTPSDIEDELRITVLTSTVKTIFREAVNLQRIWPPREWPRGTAGICYTS